MIDSDNIARLAEVLSLLQGSHNRLRLHIAYETADGAARWTNVLHPHRHEATTANPSFLEELVATIDGIREGETLFLTSSVDRSIRDDSRMMVVTNLHP